MRCWSPCPPSPSAWSDRYPMTPATPQSSTCCSTDVSEAEAVEWSRRHWQPPLHRPGAAVAICNRSNPFSTLLSLSLSVHGIKTVLTKHYGRIKTQDKDMKKVISASTHTRNVSWCFKKISSGEKKVHRLILLHLLSNN